MSTETQERYMKARECMDYAIREYYEATQGEDVEIDAEGFASDVIDSVYDATDQKIQFDDRIE